MGHYLWGVERVKRFVNVHLHCIVSNLKNISKMSMLPPPGNISADAHGTGISLILNHIANVANRPELYTNFRCHAWLITSPKVHFLCERLHASFPACLFSWHTMQCCTSPQPTSYSVNIHYILNKCKHILVAKLSQFFSQVKFACMTFCIATPSIVRTHYAYEISEQDFYKILLTNYCLYTTNNLMLGMTAAPMTLDSSVPPVPH